MSDAGRDPFEEEASFVEWASELGRDYVPGSQTNDIPMRERSDDGFAAYMGRAFETIDAFEQEEIAAGRIPFEVSPEIIAEAEGNPELQESLRDLQALNWLIDNPDRTIDDFPG